MVRAAWLTFLLGALASSPLAAEEACRCESSSECVEAARARRASDLEGARGCYDRACTLGDAGACRELADTVPWDEPPARELPLAIDAATRGCSRAHEPSCAVLVSTAMVHRRAELLPPAERACARGVVEVCYALGIAWRDADLPSSWTKARRALRRACDGGMPDGCVALAEVYTWGNEALVVAPSRRRARALWWRACDRGRAHACESGARLEQEREGALLPTRAERFLHRGCASGRSAWSCAHLYDRRCEAGDARACDALGDVALGTCTRVCRRWSSPPNHEGRTCLAWGSSCDRAFARAEVPVQRALDDAVLACVSPPGGERLVFVTVEVAVLVSGRVRVGRVRLHGASDDGAIGCITSRLASVRALEVPITTTLRLRSARGR